MQTTESTNFQTQSFTAEPELCRELLAAAAKAGEPRSALIRRALRAELDRLRAEKRPFEVRQ